MNPTRLICSSVFIFSFESKKTSETSATTTGILRVAVARSFNSPSSVLRRILQGRRDRRRRRLCYAGPSLGEDGACATEDEEEEEEEEEAELFREPRVLLSQEFLVDWISFIRTPLWCSSSCEEEMRRNADD